LKNEKRSRTSTLRDRFRYETAGTQVLGYLTKPALQAKAAVGGFVFIAQAPVLSLPKGLRPGGAYQQESTQSPSIIGGQSLGRKGNDLVFVNLNRRGDKCNSVIKVLLNTLSKLLPCLAHLWDKNELCD
jgi:hypothetical protein